MAYVKSIILIIVLLFLITFGIKNSHYAPINYYFNIVAAPIPLYGIVYISIVIGIIIGMIVGISSRVTLRRKVKHLQREARELRGKLEERAGEEEEEKGERED